MAVGQANRQLALATVAFAVAFAVWGLLAGLMPILAEEYRREEGHPLGAAAAALVVAIPVILGSLGRIPAGMLADRFGGRRTFSALLILVALPCFALALDYDDYDRLLFLGFWIGLAGASFAIGVSFVSAWFPPERQGTALGLYGTGNVGQSVAVFLAPLLAGTIGIAATFVVFGVVTLGYGVTFALAARDAAPARRREPMVAGLRVLVASPKAWALCLFYFLTFGGFVALGVYLPILLRETFHLTPTDAGARTAGFVILATAVRPVGGWLSDRIGGERVLAYAFGGVAVLAWLLVFDSIYPFTVGALGSATLLGLGNGAVFKLVPHLFPMRTGTATGLVGAAGGLGGFFPPIVLGLFRDTVGSYAPGFVLLSAFAVGCELVLVRMPIWRGPTGSAAGAGRLTPE